MDEIYVSLLEEGTDVWRPVPARRLGPSVYLIYPEAPYNRDDEIWEFPPGSRVVIAEKVLSGGTNASCGAPRFLGHSNREPGWLNVNGLPAR